MTAAREDLLSSQAMHSILNAFQANQVIFGGQEVEIADRNTIKVHTEWTDRDVHGELRKLGYVTTVTVVVTPPEGLHEYVPMAEDVA